MVAVCTGLRCQPQPRGALFQVAVSQGAPCTSPPWGSNVHGVSPRASLSHAHTTHTHTPFTPSPRLGRRGMERREGMDATCVGRGRQGTRQCVSVFTDAVSYGNPQSDESFQNALFANPEFQTYIAKVYTFVTQNPHPRFRYPSTTIFLHTR